MNHDLNDPKENEKKEMSNRADSCYFVTESICSYSCHSVLQPSSNIPFHLELRGPKFESRGWRIRYQIRLPIVWLNLTLYSFNVKILMY